MSAKFGLELDPAAVAGKRTALNLNSGSIQTVGGEGKGIDWGEAAIKAFLAEGTYGERSTDFRIPNRQITIPLTLVGRTVAEQEEGRRKLEQKVGLIQRQGGILMRRRSTGEPLYADIVGASLIVPDTYEGVVEAGVVLKLECLPDFYGDEIELDAVEETGQINALLKKSGSTAVIAGDYPGRARLILAEKAAQNQRGVFWGLRSLNYDAASTAGLVIDAYTQTALNGAATAAEAANFSGKGVRLKSPELNTWHPMLLLQSPAGIHQTQVGTYRVWIRAAAPAGTRLRLVWSSNNATASTENQSMEFVGAGFLQLLDLGEIRIEEPPFGEHWWSGTIQYETGGTVHEVALDRIWLQPLDDGAGKSRAIGVPTTTLLKPSALPTVSAESGVGAAWINPQGFLKPGERSEQAEEAISTLLKGTKFGFNIPTGVTIRGIEVNYSSFSYGGGTLVQLLKAGVVAGVQKQQASGQSGGLNQGTVTLGGPEDLWGTTWTAAQINETGFGSSWLKPAGSFLAFVIYPVSIKVYYTYSASLISGDAVIYASQTLQARYDGSFRADPTSSTFARTSEETGDLFRIPPSGIEARPCQLLVKQSRGLLPAPGSGVVSEVDAGIDKIQAQVFYRPCYIGRI